MFSIMTTRLEQYIKANKQGKLKTSIDQINLTENILKAPYMRCVRLCVNLKTRKFVHTRLVFVSTNNHTFVTRYIFTTFLIEYPINEN